jgi:hypothetical protein
MKKTTNAAHRAALNSAERRSCTHRTLEAFSERYPFTIIFVPDEERLTRQRNHSRDGNDTGTFSIQCFQYLIEKVLKMISGNLRLFAVNH